MTQPNNETIEKAITDVQRGVWRIARKVPR